MTSVMTMQAPQVQRMKLHKQTPLHTSTASSAASSVHKQQQPITTTSSSTLPTCADQSLRVISASELASHSGVAVGSSWTSIDGVVYDITRFTAQHPGGPVIRYAAGRDSTALFESYHPTKSLAVARKQLQSRLSGIEVVGRLEGATFPPPDSTFLTTVKQRCEQHLRDNSISRHHAQTLGCFEACATFLTYCVATYFVSVHGSLLAAVVLGVATARLGFVMHTGNHCAASNKVWVNRTLGHCMDLIGSSNLIWGWEHQVAHHGNPNEHGFDNDCEIGNPFVRMHPELKWSPMQRFQHITVPLAMSIGFIKWYIGDFSVLLSGTVGHVSFSVTRRDWLTMIAFKALWFVVHVLVPLYYCSVTRAVCLALLWLAIGAHYLENTFIVNHIQHGLVPPSDAHWAVKQVAGTSNWQSRSRFWNWVSGGLNHQVEHHLLPSISIYLYPYISPVVEQTCNEFGLPYYNYPTFSSAWMDMIRYLKAMGRPDFKSADFHSLLQQQKQHQVLQATKQQ